MPGNRNNFPSKIFEYALTGRAILSNQLSGADRILGPNAYYFDAHDYRASLGRMLDVLTETPRAELRRRGAEIQRHLLAEYNWETQGRRLAMFLNECLTQKRTQTSIQDAGGMLAAPEVSSSFGDGVDLPAASTSSSYNLRDLR